MYFHVPARFVNDPSSLVAWLAGGGFHAEYDAESRGVRVALDRHVAWVLPQTSRTWANLMLDVDPDGRKMVDELKVLARVCERLTAAGGEPASDDMDAEIAYIERHFARLSGVPELPESMRRDQTKIAHCLADGDWETAVVHRDRRDRCLEQLVAVCRFYD